MSNVTLFKGNSAPVIPDELRGVLGSNSLFDLAKGAGFSSRRISIRGNKFRMEVNGEEVATTNDNIDVIILGASPSFLRQWYSRPFDPKDTSPPDCWSNDNVKPHEHSVNPQAQACQKCPKNIAGSGVGTAKACQTKVNIAVVLANNIENGDIFEMTIPAKSIFTKFDQATQRGGLLGYSNFLASHNTDPRVVVTRISFDAESSTPLLWFSGVSYVPSELMAVTVAKSETEEAKRAIVFNYPKPKAEEGPQAAVAAPLQPSPASAPPTAPKSMDNAAKILEEWGDEA